MTILQLQYFQAVYEYRNMTRAANALYVSQPSVSTAIQELEDEFSVKLFLRTKPLQPTQAGQPYLSSMGMATQHKIYIHRYISIKYFRAMRK